MLSLQDFIVKNQGVPSVGDTLENKGQCTGLVEVWIHNLGLSHDWGNAKDLLTNANRNDFDVVLNNPTDFNQFPAPGCIVVWGPSWGNGYGHTGIVVIADGHTLHCFEQNNPVGAAPQVISHINYGGVTGWLVPKHMPAAVDLQAQIDTLKKELSDANGLKDTFYTELQTSLHLISDLTEEVEELKKQQAPPPPPTTPLPQPQIFIPPVQVAPPAPTPTVTPEAVAEPKQLTFDDILNYIYAGLTSLPLFSHYEPS